jgi:ergothioneine biosynthesis protein EgtB
VLAYRRHVDAAVEQLLAAGGVPPAVADLIELGLHHEQQHQELICTDLELLLAENPLAPAYRTGAPPRHRTAPPLRWSSFAEGLVEIGHRGAGFAFDNEGPRHRVLVRSFALASRAVTAGEYLAFVIDGGYRTPSLWLSDGWAAVQTRGWQAPLHWRLRDGAWVVFTLGGERQLDPHAPVCHVSHFEADAYARWAGARLPTEFEWEHAVAEPEPDARRGGGSFLEGCVGDGGSLHPAAAPGEAAIEQAYGEVWQWTASAYTAYPGFRAAPGAVGEYNGKFMSGQMVLRGASCFTPRSHARRTYRNFFQPDTRWQMAGIRLAMDG